MTTQTEKNKKNRNGLIAFIWPPLRSFLSGTCSGIAKCTIGHPFDTL